MPDVVASGRHVRRLGSIWSFTEILHAPDVDVRVDALDEVVVTRPKNVVKADAPQGPLEEGPLAAATQRDDEAWAFVGARISGACRSSN